jgi:hypothetical protein
VADITDAAGGLRVDGGGNAACLRVAGSIAGAGEPVAARSRAGLAVAVAAAAGVVFGTMLRAIGRGFGSGTLGAACAAHPKPASPIPSASVAVDVRSLAANAIRKLAGGWSRNRGGPAARRKSMPSLPIRAILSA